jgi:hypothetical protein
LINPQFVLVHRSQTALSVRLYQPLDPPVSISPF